MIFKSGFPSSPDVDILISGVSVDYTSIESIELDFEENAHDMAVLTFTGLPPRAITDYINAPVQIKIESSPARYREFYGYVCYVEPTMVTRRGLVNKSPVQKARVVCFGASIDMTEKKNKVWENMPFPQLVKNLSEQYGMSYSVPNDYFTWTRILQNNKSNWELLVEVCTSLGYVVTANGTHIHVYDPYKAISRKLPYVELMTVRGLSGATAYAPGNILEFTGTFGEYTPDGHASTYRYVGIDNSGNMITTDNMEDDISYSGFGEKIESRFVNTITKDVTSLDMLKRFAGAALRQRYPYNATAITTGIPEPVPGSIARVDEYDSNFDGYWLVRKVKHRITRSNYVTELSLSTDSTSRVQPIIRPVAAFKEPPSTALNGDQWVSIYSMEDIYAG